MTRTSSVEGDPQMAPTDIRTVLHLYFENQAKSLQGFRSKYHRIAKRRLELLSEYVVNLDIEGARLTPFLLWHGASTDLYAPGDETAHFVSRIGVDNTGTDDPDRLFDFLSGVATDDIRKRNEAA